MVFVDVLVSAGIGHLAALRAVSAVREENAPVRSRALSQGLVFVLLIYLPGVTLFLFKFPSLDWLYLLDPTWLHHVGFVFAVPLFFYLGFANACFWIRRSTFGVSASLVALATAVMVLVAVFWRRATTVAQTSEEFHLGLGVPILQTHAITLGLLVISIQLVAFLLWWTSVRVANRL